MTTEGPVLSEPEVAAVRRGVPDPGIALPRVAVPTVLLFAANLAVWTLATWLVLGGFGAEWLWLSIPLHTLVSFAMFTVLHESTHHAAGRLTWVNELLGRLSIPFVAAWGSFPMVRYVHIEHHRNTNEDIHTDPDAWTERGPAWQLPLRWLTVDAWYLRFYLPRTRTRPRAEVAEATVMLFTSIAVFATVIATGHLWELAVIYLIPQRIGLGILAWWFDWLPHHDLGVTARTDRFRATRVRVGWERLFTPVMLYQNYHLVHHIHPTIPFYRYIQAWRRTEEDYLDRAVPIATAWGRALSPGEYRAWRGITGSPGGEPPAAGRPRYHRLCVSEVRPLTADSVSITFVVPDDLRETFRFTPGQHVAVRALVDGRELRRTYSLCSAAGSGVLRIAVKRVPGGAFSDHVLRWLRSGDELDVLPPTGRFTVTPRPGTSRHLAAVAAGSGITPVISIVASTLLAEPGSRATLLYANRDRASTMFADELTMLARRFEGRLRIVHFHSRPDGGAEALTPPDVPRYERTVAGHLTPERLAELWPELAGADAWYLCGPERLADRIAGALTERGVPGGDVHRERFTGTAEPGAAVADVVPATVSVTLDGRTTELDVGAGESLLEGALRHRLDAPYSCTGGACGTCRATLLSGTVQMEQNYALGADEVSRGSILTCQSRATSAEVAIDYDR
ncbi:fatty acid desaturase [Prauserella shujinwangii]|uniref:fatty acid desaturase n=1 Tax=Prauserella shujinwangii TaxID=1453103 RepID=UPI001FE72B18|nr:fatty acid desaturase [Prauserella shujinwangii]